jgi:hypothetical protein
MSRPASREARRFRAFAVLFVTGCTAGLFFAGDELRAVLAPALVVAAVTLLYLSVQIRREGHLPIFEAATFFVLATAVYSIVPLLQFALGGMEIGLSGDNRLHQWQPTPAEFGNFAWRHVFLATTFVFVYLPVRGRRLWPLRTPARPMRTTTAVILATMIGLTLWFFLLKLYTGPGVNPYEGTGTPARPVPYVVLQLANVLFMVRLTLKQCLVVLLLLGWKRRPYRYGLLLWIAAEAVVTVVALGSRSAAMILLLTFLVGYHRLVRPLRVSSAFVAGAVVLLGFLLFGVFRDIDPDMRSQGHQAIWGAATEFQVLYGNAYDLQMRKTMEMLPALPRQLPFCDLYRLIPSQLLPFYKWDPAQWYMEEVLGLRGTGGGLMFGIVAQSVVGFGYYELIARAFLLALFYAFAHRVYRRYSHSFWMTIAYLFILTWAYYAFRSTSFEILYRLIYYLAPTWLIVKLLTIVVTRAKASWQRMAVPA